MKNVGTTSKFISKESVIIIAIVMITSSGLVFTPASSSGYFLGDDTIKAAPGSMIKLKYSTFDPMVITPDLPSALSAPDYAPVVRAPFIIQAEGKITEEWKQDLMAAGVEIVGYVPDNALLVRMNEDTKLTADAVSGVRWSGAYEPAYKISPRLTGVTGNVVIDISLFDSGHNGNVVKLITKIAGGKIISYVNNPNHKSVRAEVDASWISQLAQIADVKWIDEFEQPRPMNDSTVPLLQSGIPSGPRPIHNAVPAPGIDGLDEVVTLVDSGIRNNHENFMGSVYTSSFNQPKIKANYIPPSTPPNVQLGDYPPSYHGTFMAGVIAGDGPTYGVWDAGQADGHAFMAQIVMQDAGDSAQPTSIFPPVDMYNDAFGDAEILYGSKIHSNSWGGGAGYGDDAAIIDQYSWDSQDFTILFSAGADGFTGPPGRQAEAKNIIVVGGTSNDGTILWSSTTRGPRGDGRLYPEVIAPAVNIQSVDGASTTTTKLMSGTSSATAAVAGTSALVRQYYREGWYPTGAPMAVNGWSPSAALIKASFVNGAVDILGTRPDNNQGWGRVHLDNSLYFAGDSKEMVVLDQSEGMVTGDYLEYEFGVTDNTEPFKVSLVWTDYPANPAAAKQLVNDLDLTVTAPGGTTYRGNVFAGGYSTTGGAYDTLNNIEGVFLNSPTTGAYTIRINASSIGMGPQNFALVVTGNFDDGYGWVTMDRTVYDETDTINLRVEDLNSIAATLDVQLTGSISGDSENVTLTRTGVNSGVYTGSIDTDLNLTTTQDGKLQVSDGETITATYSDTSPAHDSIATAYVDFHGPVITNVFVENILGTSAIVTWDTNENANSTVYYRIFGGGGFSVSGDYNLALQHRVPLTGLTENTKYEFWVESTDWRGRTTYDDNGGRYYTFTTTGATSGGALILYVDDDDGALSEGGAGVPFEQDWFNMFNQYGWTYSSWEVVTLGNPTFADLNQAPMIIWSSAEGYPQIGAADRAAVGPYLDQALTSGGTVPMAWLVGQDIGWDMNPGGTDVNQAWYQSYLAATFLGDDADGGGGTEGGAFQVIQAAPNHALNSVYNLNNIDLEQDAFDAGGGRFWPDDVSVRAGGEIAMDYSSHAYGGDSSIIVQQSGGAANAARIVYNAYAHEMIASTNNGAVDWNPPAVDPERGQMLDQTIQWLLGGNHPTVNFVPAGGPSGTYVTNSITIDWTVSGAVSVDLYYSPNSGQEYVFLQSFGGGSPGTYVWDTTVLEDATTYRVKLVALGTATYATLSDVDESLDFEINHGVDTIPPITIPGSVYVDKNPVEPGENLIVNATITDADTGRSNITAAEWVEGANASWPGTPMTASDGLFDQVIEGVTVTIPGSTTASWTPDVWHTIWVRGQDAAGNWAGSYSTDVYVVGVGFTSGSDLTSMSVGDWVFVSFNVTATGLITDVINDTAWGDGASDWDIAQWYDPNDADGDYWKTYNKGYAGTQEMPSVSNAMGFWLRLSRHDVAPNDNIMSMGAGAAPVPQSINLVMGWNLVGYPSDTSQLASVVFAANPEVTKIAYFNVAQLYLLTETTNLASVWMSRGNAYWVYATANAPWTVG